MSAKCPRCKKSVYAAEQVIGAGAKWHDFCFKCAKCSKRLDSTSLQDRDGEIYCKSCYGKEFGPVGFRGNGGTINMMKKPEDYKKSASRPTGASKPAAGPSSFFGAKCPRCAKSVYAAEQVIGAGSKWHNTCFKCALCSKRLDSTNVQDREGEIYCKSCYGKEFGPVGFRGNGGTINMMKKPGDYASTSAPAPAAPAAPAAAAAAPAPAAAAASAGAPPKFCPECGAKNSGGKFCSECGNKF